MINIIFSKCRQASLPNINIIIQRNFFNPKINVWNTRKSGTPLFLKNKPSSSSLMRIRTFFNSHLREFNVPPAFKQLDGVRPNYELIYRSNIPSYLVAAQLTLSGVTVYVVTKILIGILNVAISANPPAGGSDGIEAVGTEGTISKAPTETVKDVQPPQLKVEESQEETKDERLGFLEQLKNVLKDLDEDESKLSAEDQRKRDLQMNLIFLAVLSTYFMMLHVLLKRTPIRMYASSTGHCVSVQLSSFKPAQRTLKDYQMGTLRPIRSSVKIGKSDTFMYQDPNARLYFLLENSFRSPADYHNVLDSDY